MHWCTVILEEEGERSKLVNLDFIRDPSTLYGDFAEPRHYIHSIASKSRATARPEFSIHTNHPIYYKDCAKYKHLFLSEPRLPVSASGHYKIYAGIHMASANYATAFRSGKLAFAQHLNDIAEGGAASLDKTYAKG